MTSSASIPSLRTGQVLHFVGLLVLMAALLLFWMKLGQPVPIAFWVALAIPILHQIFVWLCWRFELRSSATSRTLGFRLYLVLFFLLFFGRFVSLAILAWLDRGSLAWTPVIRIVVAGVLGILGVYAGYSVIRYFGMVRAAGADHFESRYRRIPLVREGIFGFTRNGMYFYAFLLFWSIAVGFNSSAALLVAAFSHGYIWIHYFATEKPDMEFLYGSGPVSSE